MASRDPMLSVTILGVEEADALLSRLNSGVEVAAHQVTRVGTAVVYAWGIEFGRRRSGRTARAAGGAFMLTNALARVRNDVPATLERALPNGDDATRKALLGLGYQVEALAKAATPTRTGNLRRSIHTVQGAR